MGLLGVRSVDFSSYDERAPVQFSATWVFSSCAESRVGARSWITSGSPDRDGLIRHVAGVPRRLLRCSGGRSRPPTSAPLRGGMRNGQGCAASAPVRVYSIHSR